MEQSITSHDSASIYNRLDAYDWDHDPEFQAGLSTILTSAPADQAPRLALRARCYYFARKFNERVDFEDYLSWKHHPVNGTTTTTDRNPTSTQPTHPQTTRPQPTHPHPTTNTPQHPPPPTEPPQQQQQQSSNNNNSTMGAAPPPASFADICALIAAGEPVPGIKEIPDVVLEGQASVRRMGGRRKPWERDGGGASSFSSSGGAAGAGAGAGGGAGSAENVPVWARTT